MVVMGYDTKEMTLLVCVGAQAVIFVSEHCHENFLPLLVCSVVSDFSL